ncbi:MAG: hypothetical protein A3D19_03580 [Deltaproteobacteria bacterium RIFCSPHIGHO2_02_FULL_38_15]|nr:MAG: hypothetical protein A3D19_03580 [Deltaproteobacteria bacterium RIFCSPHIGHO2_02_FULL_38_15]OGQ33833.1 MAG: hypothetical protein A3A72_08980 [Deltaproteobacteria bacterium RIFCSPLOWO2_01_FULL_38_9]
MDRQLNMREQAPKFSSVIEALDYWNKTCPDENYCYLNHFNGQEEKITYKNLYEEASLQSSKLQSLGLKRGDRVILAIPNGRSFLTSFLGTLMAGGVAVPVVTRETILQSLNKAAEVLGHIFRDAAAKYVLTTESNKALCEKTAEKVSQSVVISIVDRLPKGVQLSYNPLTVFPEDVAFIQYTSGSTSLPKGVVIRHEQLVAQIQSLIHGLKSNARDCAVSWLPLFHDMGLIGAFLHTLYAGMQLVLMSPEKFLFDPKQWLLAISKYKATMSTGPNSAYSLCLNRIRPEEMKDIDLSSWRVAFSGAEPISVPTIEKFIKRFEPYGFNPKAFVSGYGMAENCLAISFVQPGEGLIYDTVQREEFELNRVAIPDLTQTAVPTLCFVSVGKPILDHEVVIIDDLGNMLAERHVGEIAVRGPSVMDGYYQRELETRQAIRNHWLYTGDLGYLADGHLYIVGRKKDMIIKGGRNFCPQDIEVVVESITGVRRGCVVTFGVYEEKMGTEKLVVLAEVKPDFYKKRDELSSRIVSEVSSRIGIAPDEVVIFPRGTLTKTTSGKLQRAKYKALYLEGKLNTVISLKDRFRYFIFRTNLIISMFFYMMSSLLKRKKHD